MKLRLLASDGLTVVDLVMLIVVALTAFLVAYDFVSPSRSTVRIQLELLDIDRLELIDVDAGAP